MNDAVNRSWTPRSPTWEFIAFAFIIVIIGINASLAFRTVENLSERHRSITNTGNTIVAIKDLHQSILAAKNAQRGYLLTKDEAYLAKYRQALKVLNMRIAAVRAMNTEDPAQAQRIERILSLSELQVEQLQLAVSLWLKGSESEAVKLALSEDGRDLHRRLGELFEDMEAQEFSSQSKSYSQLMRAQEDSRTLFFVFLSISCLLLVGVLLLLKSNLSRERQYRQVLEQRATELEENVRERTQELTLYSEELKRSNRELEDFAFVASHDLQEPLRKIRAFASRIENHYHDKLDDKGKDYLQRMNNAAERMSSLIQDLLEFSRIKTRGREFSTVDLSKVVNAVIDDLEVAIENSQATVEIEPLPKIEADASQMTQLFINLLSNAIKFRNPNAPPAIQISYRKINHDLNGIDIECHEIKVNDNGIGFEQIYADRIFMPFQRLYAREEYEGTGIGLAVCRRIVERHGGKISVISAPGEGSEFTLLLPLININFDKDFGEIVENGKLSKR